ncbi:hypothetical protein QQF64_018391, partial [Cirrhinus molitorella]
LSCCHITQKGLDALISALRSNPSHPHWLRNCSIEEEGCAALISALRSNPSHMRELSLSLNKPGDSGVNLLCALLEDPHCKLETLR